MPRPPTSEPSLPSGRPPPAGRPPSSPPHDEIERVVDEVARAFADLLPPDELARAHEFALDAFAAQPVARLLAERLRSARPGDESTEQPSQDAPRPVGAAPGKASGDDR